MTAALRYCRLPTAHFRKDGRLKQDSGSGRRGWFRLCFFILNVPHVVGSRERFGSVGFLYAGGVPTWPRNSR